MGIEMQLVNSVLSFNITGVVSILMGPAKKLVKQL